MRVFLQKERRTVEIHHSGSAGALLAQLGINPEAVLIVADGALVTLDDDISAAHSVELLSVVSGG